MTQQGIPHMSRQPGLPIDLVLGTYPGKATSRSYSDYIKTLRDSLQESYILPSEHSKRMGEKNKARFDKKIRTVELFVGNRVLVRNVNIRGKHKFANCCEQVIHTVVM